MRSECEHVLRIGAEQEERIALLLEEIVRMQKERIESAADDAKDLAGNLRKEISDFQSKYERVESAADDAKDLAGNLRKEISELQAKYEQTCESACKIQSRLESIQEIHKFVW